MVMPHQVRARKRHRHRHGGGAPYTPGKKKILLLGHPNVGKSVIFSHLTGMYMTVSNYPGTTVEVAAGKATFDHSIEVVDTPGISSLLPHSEDERVTFDILYREGGNSKIVIVADSKNLRRSLLLATYLAEMGLPFLLDLNMRDEAQNKGIEIDTEKLSEIFGVDVVETVATEGEGIPQLLKALERVKKSTFFLSYEQPIENALSQILPLLPPTPVDKRFVGLMLLCGNEPLKERLRKEISEENWRKIESITLNLQASSSEPLALRIERHRNNAVEKIVKKVVKKRGVPKTTTLFEKVGEYSMHPIFGLPLLLFILYLVYKFVGQFAAGTVVDFLETIIFGKYINPLFVEIFSPFPLLIREFFVGNYGLLTMGLTYAIAIVFPVVTAFFLAFSLLEDTGYLPRLAALMNRALKVMGLSGKAVLPLVLGLGCDTMATLTARILETRKERIIATLLLALAIPCSAQLGVIIGLLSSISLKAFLLYIIAISFQLLFVGFLASKVIKGETSDFIIEIPPFRIPKISNIIVKTLYRVEWFLKEAVPLFLLGTAILFFLDKLGILSLLERISEPVVKTLLNLPPQTTEAFILGFLRRDYGAAGLFKLARLGQLDPLQILVSMIVITLFVPCIANFLVIIKERGLKTALLIVGFIFPYAFLVGGLINHLLRFLGVRL
jgi:ferrous iron transport protein B